MRENPYQENPEEMKEYMVRLENLRNGRQNSFIEEEAFEKLIDYLLEKEDLALASETADLAMEQYPYSSSLMLKKADIHITSRNYQKALAMLSQAELLDNRDINLYILKTDVYLALDQHEKAVALLEEALQLFQGDEKLELLFELADVYDDYEEFDKVFDCLKVILEMDPTNEEALYKICFWTDFTGRNEESIRLHQQIIDESPYSELAWFNLGAAYQGLKLYEKAIDAYKYSIVIDEKFDYAYRNMGDAYIRMRKYKDAIEVLLKVNELSKPEAVIYEAIGYCYDGLKNYAQARFYYRKAQHMQPEDARLIYKMANTYFHEKRWESCIKQLEPALKMQPNTADFNLLMGEAHLQLENYAEAATYFSAVVNARSKSVRGWEAMIRCLYYADMLDEAETQAKIAFEITDGKPIFRYYLAAIYLINGSAKQAYIEFETALIEAPKMLKRFLQLTPVALQNQQILEIIARHKKKKK